jgi:hypothetical protein
VIERIQCKPQPVAEIVAARAVERIDVGVAAIDREVSAVSVVSRVPGEV